MERRLSPIHVGQRWEQDPTELLIRSFSQPEADLAALARVRNETLRALEKPEEFEEVDALSLDRFYNRPGFNLEGNSWLVFLRDEPVAAAVIYPRAFFNERPPGNFDLYVAPSVARHGLGSRLLAHVEQAAWERGHRTLETTIASEDSASTAFLSGRGFNIVAKSAHMAFDGPLQAPEVPTLPPGFEIKSLEDLQEPPELYVETTNRLAAYDLNYSLVTPEQVDYLVTAGTWEPEGVLFLMAPHERIAGIIRASGAHTRQGSLHEIRLEPALRGSGLGAALLASALRYLAVAGVTRIELDTNGENTAAHNLALKAGFRVTRHWLHFLKPLTRPEKST
ncbi:MAG TPA: GNAT family N-acetyltransferase [Chloroflexia bacterium]|nr:GNAT family N-acetyltransferase [Chloroflexia bacterium]